MERERRKDDWVGVSDSSTVPKQTGQAEGEFLVKGAPWLPGMGLLQFSNLAWTLFGDSMWEVSLGANMVVEPERLQLGS